MQDLPFTIWNDPMSLNLKGWDLGVWCGQLSMATWVWVLLEVFRGSKSVEVLEVTSEKKRLRNKICRGKLWPATAFSDQAFGHRWDGMGDRISAGIGAGH